MKRWWIAVPVASAVATVIVFAWLGSRQGDPPAPDDPTWPDESAPAVAVVHPADPFAAPAPPHPAGELGGEWRGEQTLPDGTAKRTHLLRFVDATQLTWEIRHQTPGQTETVTRRAKYQFGAGELRLEILSLEPERIDQFGSKSGVQLGERERVFSVSWESAERSAFRVRFGGVDPVWAEAVFRRANPDPVPPYLQPAEYLTRIDRRIGKLPGPAGKASYLLLAFGPKAQFRVWLVDTGSTVLVDRNGNGDLTDDGPAVPFNRNFPGFYTDLWMREPEPEPVTADLGELTDPHTGDKYHVELCHIPFIRGQYRYRGWWQSPVTVTQNGKLVQTANYDPADKLPDTPILHFGSRDLVMWPGSVLGAESPHWPRQFAVALGTPGIGPRSFVTYSGYDLVRNYQLRWREDVAPVVDVEFTPLTLTEPPKRIRVVMRSRHYGHSFDDQVPVPEGVKAGLDAAKVTLTFPNCPWGEVKPATYTVDVMPKAR